MVVSMDLVWMKMNVFVYFKHFDSHLNWIRVIYREIAKFTLPFYSLLVRFTLHFWDLRFTFWDLRFTFWDLRFTFRDLRFTFLSLPHLRYFLARFTLLFILTSLFTLLFLCSKFTLLFFREIYVTFYVSLSFSSSPWSGSSIDIVLIDLKYLKILIHNGSLSFGITLISKRFTLNDRLQWSLTFAPKSPSKPYQTSIRNIVNSLFH